MSWKSLNLTSLSLTIMLGAAHCKNNPSSEEKISQREAKNLLTEGSKLNLLDNKTSTPDLFKGTGKDIYGMSRAELQWVPPGVLEREISILETRNNNEIKDLAAIKSFNLAMCRRLEKLKEECLPQLYISNDHGLDGLNCTNSEEAPPEKETQITVNLEGSEEKSFMLVADGVYVTDEFDASKHTALTFRREDNKVVKPPRFRDIESLVIVAIKPGGTRFDHVAMPAFDQFKVRLNVNGQALLSTDEEGYVTLVKPDDKNQDWFYRFDPNGINRLGRSKTCTVSLQELKELQKNSQSQ